MRSEGFYAMKYLLKTRWLPASSRIRGDSFCKPEFGIGRGYDLWYGMGTIDALPFRLYGSKKGRNTDGRTEPEMVPLSVAVRRGVDYSDAKLLWRSSGPLPACRIVLEGELKRTKPKQSLLSASAEYRVCFFASRGPRNRNPVHKVARLRGM